MYVFPESHTLFTELPRRGILRTSPYNGVTVGDEHHYTAWPPSTIIAHPTKAEAPLEQKPRLLLRVGINFLYHLPCREKEVDRAYSDEQTN